MQERELWSQEAKRVSNTEHIIKDALRYAMLQKYIGKILRNPRIVRNIAARRQ